jgi:twitching motility protein PilT
MTNNIDNLLKLSYKNNASDLHILSGVRPTLRVHGNLEPLVNHPVIDEDKARELVLQILDEQQKDKFLADKEMDFSYSIPNGIRFRVNIYHSKGVPAASFRLIPEKIPSIEELNLPEILHRFVGWKQGLVLVTGPSGHGKSTTVASTLDEINSQRNIHLITIEDPIEFVLKPKEAIISQREIIKDTLNWERALRSVLREDPDVIFVGEMRDLESIEMVLSIAETGHLVFSTLHTNSAAETIDRIIDVFPKGAQEQVRIQMANTLRAVVSQRLIPTIDKKLVPAVEILLSNSAVRNSIRENKTHMINNIIQTSLELGMKSLERSLAYWVKEGRVDKEVARSYALDQEKLNRLLER